MQNLHELFISSLISCRNTDQQGRENKFEVKGGGRICAFTQYKKCQNFVLLLIPKQYHLKCKNNINIVLYLGFADIIFGAFNKNEIFIQDTGLVEYRL